MSNCKLNLVPKKGLQLRYRPIHALFDGSQLLTDVYSQSFLRGEADYMPSNSRCKHKCYGYSTI